MTSPTARANARGSVRLGSRTSRDALAISSKPSYATKMSIPAATTVIGDGHEPGASLAAETVGTPAAITTARTVNLMATITPSVLATSPAFVRLTAHGTRTPTRISTRSRTVEGLVPPGKSVAV